MRTRILFFCCLVLLLTVWLFYWNRSREAADGPPFGAPGHPVLAPGHTRATSLGGKSP